MEYMSLDYKTLEEEAIELHQDGIQSEVDYDWSEADNSYHVNIWQTVQGLLVVDSSIFVNRFDVLREATTSLYLNKDGIFSFNQLDTLEFVFEDEYELLLSFDKIMECFREQAEVLNIIDAKTIDRIELRAYPIKDGNVKRLIPIWIFKASSDLEYEGEIYKRDDYYKINAITGELL